MYTLAPHQVYASEMADMVDALAIYYEAGTGKTASILDWAYRSVQSGQTSSILIICPASLVGNWMSNIDKMRMFEGYTDEGIDDLRRVVTVRSFQRTYKTEKREVHHRNGATSVKRSTKIRDDIDHPWDAVIVDEAHCIGNHSSVQTRACLTIGRMAKRRYILTGTPVSGGGGAEDFQKLYGQLKFLDDGVWSSWSDFVQRYVVTIDPWGKPRRYKDDELRQLMYDYGIVARLRDCVDMPSKTETVIPCELSEKTVYKDIQRGNIAKYGLDVRTSGVIYGKLLQLCSGHIKNGDKPLSFITSKAQALEDILCGTDDKVVVFCQYTASVDLCAGICAKHGKTAVYDGRSKGETWRELQYGDAQYLVCQYQSGGWGLDLYASSTMVLFEPTQSSLLLEQSLARIYRTGQTFPCRYLHLVTPGTIEERVSATVRSGVDVTTQMLEEWAKL